MPTKQTMKTMEKQGFVSEKNTTTTVYRFDENRKLNGFKRVLVFFILIVIVPFTLIMIPLHLKRRVFADVTYPVAESDIIEIRDGISSIFCKQHSLKMATQFNAFQLRSKPEISTNHKHIRLKKSMTLPDDTFEYWGFYLLKGARVLLKFCSRYEGARMLVVKGARELDTCGLLDHNRNKYGANYPQDHEQVRVFFEDMKEIAVQESPTDLNGSAPYEPISEKQMELENRGGENLFEDYDYDADMDSWKTTAKPTPAPTRIPRKKLKNGSPKFSKQKSRGDKPPKRARQSSPDHSPESDREKETQKQQLYNKLYKNRRHKRDQIYDRKYTHGGNAMNFTQTDESNSVSSFETGLLECFKTNKLSFGDFPPIAECTNPHFLENGSHRMLSIHEIDADGYYYYIFYSDNDLVRNDIHAIFDIYKPTFLYSNLSDSQACINATSCSFPIRFLSHEIVVVEVPTRDGIEHEDDDITNLISTCHPRTEIYIIFPILVLIIILLSSYL
ncbi:uncharacterized protein LOC101889298 [Musca domestica]|uniref:Uncharacterized protein LOC101889298 n=2 Tax=Musca domestica TaxID=7370 RepID=A0A9J7CPJ8_MUSDO|nr:uncharacterized protein LOC101889298 [Musca domestica]